MEKIITISSVIIMIIAAFMLLDIVYKKIVHKIFNSEVIIKYASLLIIGSLFYKLPNSFGLLAFLFFLLLILLTKMFLLTNKLINQNKFNQK